MSLATRCPHCNTIFRVVQDQLKVSGGWVRCGRCQEVFNAVDALFDLDRDPPPRRQVKEGSPPVESPPPPSSFGPASPAPSQTAGFAPASIDRPMAAGEAPPPAPALPGSVSSAQPPAPSLAPPVPQPTSLPADVPAFLLRQRTAPAGNAVPPSPMAASLEPAAQTVPAPPTTSPTASPTTSPFAPPDAAPGGFGTAPYPPHVDPGSPAVSMPPEQAPWDPAAGGPHPGDEPAATGGGAFPGAPFQPQPGTGAEAGVEAHADAVPGWDASGSPSVAFPAPADPDPAEGDAPAGAWGDGPQAPPPQVAPPAFASAFPADAAPPSTAFSASPAAPSAFAPAPAGFPARTPPGREAAPGVPFDDLPSTQEDDALDSRWLMRPARDGRSASQRHASDWEDFADARFPMDVDGDDDLDDDAFDEPAAPAGREGGAPLSASAEDTEADATGGASPSFVTRADRRAAWRRPAVRATLAGVALALALLLGVQVAVHFDDALAARLPQAKPLLVGLCRWAGCEIDPPREIDQLAVEHVSITGPIRSDPRPNVYRLEVAVHNAAPFAVARPALELSLTDEQGALASRRVIRQDELAPGATPVPGSATATYTLLLQTEGTPVAGYSVEAFYP